MLYDVSYLDLQFEGFYIMQIAEVVNSMKDLIDFSRDNNLGPIGIFFFAYRVL